MIESLMKTSRDAKTGLQSLYQARETKMKMSIDLNLTAADLQLFTGIEEATFATLLARLQPIWKRSETQRLSKKPRIRSIGAGGQYKLCIESLLFMYLFYCRHYVNQYIIARLCHLHQSNVSRLFRRIEEIVAQAADPRLNRFFEDVYQERERTGVSFTTLKMKYPEIEKVITDVTEIRCNRPKHAKKRNKTFSGKTKQCLLKKQVSIGANQRTLATSRIYSGSIHDISIEKSERMIDNVPQESFQPLDLGYLGIRKLYPDHYIVLPPKRTQRRKLHRIERDMKKRHSKQRIHIEHTFARLKHYNILKLYRGPKSRFDHVFDNIAAMYNLQLNC